MDFRVDGSKSRYRVPGPGPISKEDEVQKILTSIFVTNFPEYAKARDLWNVCKQYGHVVDAFIPGRRSKKGKAISKEDEVQKILTSIFVTNFPEYAKARDLWNVCKQYGHVVDAFIPGRRSKKGKGKAKSIEDCEPVMVLDEACLNHQEYSLGILGKVKEFSILANVKVVLGSEGFSDIELNYMG
nr:hypothetical protein [Tanacetum cinerariifolium]